MNRIVSWLSILGMLLLSGCSIFQNTAEPTATPTPTLDIVPTAQNIESTEPVLPTATELPLLLDEEALKNSVFFAPQYQKQVHLIDGLFNSSSDAEEYSVNLLPQIAIGDINEDEDDDAVVILAESMGGTGVFHSLVVITSLDGQYQQAATVYIDDRPIIDSVDIDDHCIDLRATIHDAADIMVSPTLNVRRRYCFIDHTLVLMRQDSRHERSSEHLIEIVSPANGSEVTTGVQLSGGVSVAPFENNLSLKILDLAGNELMATGFLVNSESMGMPATFNTLVTLPTLPSGTIIQLELTENSMLDGSMIAMNSVYVTVK